MKILKLLSITILVLLISCSTENEKIDEKIEQEKTSDKGSLLLDSMKGGLQYNSGYPVVVMDFINDTKYDFNESVKVQVVFISNGEEIATGQQYLNLANSTPLLAGIRKRIIVEGYKEIDYYNQCDKINIQAHIYINDEKFDVINISGCDLHSNGQWINFKDYQN